MRIAAAALAALALSLVSGAAAAKPATAASRVHRDWTGTVVATPQGGFRMGNPAAPVKLIEYGSLACPHCRHFAETGYKPLLQNYVRSGRVSYEFRNLLLNEPDMTVSLLAHCAGAAKFFPMSEVVYATQPQWFGRVEAMTDDQRTEIEGLPTGQRMVRIGDIAGLTQLAAHFGVTAARARQCLADSNGLNRLLNVTQSAEDAGIGHTPTFLINGKVTTAATWEDLEPELKKAVGR